MHCLLLQVLGVQHIPVSRSSLFFPSAFPPFGFCVVMIRCFEVFSVFFFFFSLFFETFYVVFPLFSFWPLSQCNSMLLVFTFLLLFLARLSCRLFINICGPPATSFAPLKKAWMLCGGHVAAAPSLNTHSPSNTYPQLCPARPPTPLCTFFCVCCVPMHPPGPIRTHPHPPESLITLLCLCAHVCVFPGNLPAIHVTLSYPVISVLFFPNIFPFPFDCFPHFHS